MALCRIAPAVGVVILLAVAAIYAEASRAYFLDDDFQKTLSKFRVSS